MVLGGEPINWSHIGILTRSYARNAIRSGGGLVFLLTFIVVGLLIASVILDPISELGGMAASFGGNVSMHGVIDAIRPIVAWWIDADGAHDPRVSHLLIDRPALLSGIMIVFMAFIPVTACLAGFNQTSGDIASRGLRYLVIRTERVNIVLSRFLGVLLFTGVVTLILVALIALYIGAKFGFYGAGELILWSLQLWIAIVIFSAPYLALCAWISAAFDSAGASLVMTLLISVLSFSFINAMQAFVANSGWMDKITPWGWKYDLVHPSAGAVLLAVAVLLTASAALLYLGVRTFQKRDL